MTQLFPQDPFAHRLGRLFGNMLSSTATGDASQWFEPRLDLSEDDRQYTLRADLPGVKKEDIEVDIDGNRVSIGAHVKRSKSKKNGDSMIHSERFEGRLHRSVTLEQDVDAAKSQAKFSDGVLELVMPKAGRRNGKRLTVA